MEQDTTSTMSRLLIPRSFIDIAGLIVLSGTSSATSMMCFFTVAITSSRVIGSRPPWAQFVSAPPYVSLKPQRRPLIVEAHQIVAESSAAIDHHHLSAHPVHQTAAQRQDGVGDFFRLDQVARHVRPLEKTFELVPERGAQ